MYFVYKSGSFFVNLKVYERKVEMLRQLEAYALSALRDDIVAFEMLSVL